MNVDKLVEDIDDGEEAEAPTPREKYHPEDIASDEDLAAEKVPATGDASWEDHAAPFMELFKSGPQTMQAIKLYGTRLGVLTKFAEEIVFWLENRGRIEPFKRWDGKKTWKLPGSAEPAGKPLPMKEQRVAKQPKEWISTDDAMKMLDLGRSRVMVLAREGKLKARKIENSGVKGRPPWEFLRSSVLEHQLNFLEPGETPPRTPKKVVALVPRKPATPAMPRRPAPISGDLAAQLRWVVDGHRLGRFSADQVVEQLAELIG